MYKLKNEMDSQVATYTTVGYPPGFPLKALGYSLMQRNPVGNLNFFVQSAMNYHHRAFHFLNAVNVGIDIEAS